jgi:hypothetical protein
MKQFMLPVICLQWDPNERNALMRINVSIVSNRNVRYLDVLHALIVARSWRSVTHGPATLIAHTNQQNMLT